MGPARRRRHPRLHRPRHRRAAARPRRPVEPHHQLPGAARAAGAGLACRHHPANRHDRVGPGPGRRGAGRPPGQPHPRPAQPDPQPRREPATSSATSCASKTILAACRTFRRPLAWSSGSATARRKPKLALSLGNAYLGVPGLRDLDQAEHWYQHSLSLRPDSDQLGRARSLASSARSPWQRFDDARAAGEAEPVLLEHLNAALGSLPASPGPAPPPTTTKPAPSSRTSSASSTAGPGTPARRCATTSKPSSTKKPGETSTGPGRPATTSPSSSTMPAGSVTPCCMPAPPWTTTSRPGPAPPTDAGRRRAAHRRPGTTQPLTGHPARPSIGRRDDRGLANAGGWVWRSRTVHR